MNAQPDPTPPEREATDRWRGLLTATSDGAARTDEEAVVRIRAIAAAVGRSVTADRQLRADLVEEAPTILWAAFERYDRAKPFGPWAFTVLRNQLITRIRAARPSASLTGGERDPGVGPPSAGDVGAWFAEAADELARAAFFPAGAADHDYYALFWLDARLRAAEALGSPPATGPDLHRAGLVFAWPAWVGPRRFAPDWPRVADVWADLARPGHYPRGRRLDAVRCSLGRLAPGMTFANNTWHQWITRAARSVRAALERVSPGAWGRTFRPLLAYNPCPGPDPAESPPCPSD